MKLTGSRAEFMKKEELLNSEKYVKENKKITNFLNERYGCVKSTFVLAHTPEQGEDIYRILINGDLVVGFELSRTDSNFNEVFEMSVADYLKQLTGKLNKLNLMIALDLAKNRKE